MQLSTSFLIMDGVWQEILIISSKENIQDKSDGIVMEVGEHYETIYNLGELLRSFVENEMYFNWYIIKSKTIKEREMPTIKENIKVLQEITDQLLLAQLEGGI